MPRPKLSAALFVGESDKCGHHWYEAIVLKARKAGLTVRPCCGDVARRFVMSWRNIRTEEDKLHIVNGLC